MRKFAIVVIGGVFALGVGAVCRDAVRRPPSPQQPHQCPGLPPDRSLDPLHASSRAKRDAAFRVIRDRLSLLEAAELFRVANGPEGVKRLNLLPGRTIRERLCRQVIWYVTVIEAERTGAGEGTHEASHVASLMKELERLQAADELFINQ